MRGVNKERMEYLIVILLIFLNEKTVLFGTNSNSSFTNIQYLFFAGIVFCYGMLALNQSRKDNRRLLGLFMLIIPMMITSAIFLDFRGGLFISILLLLAGFTYVSSITPFRFMECFSSIIFYLSVYSIGIYFAYLIFPEPMSAVPKITNTAGILFNNYIFSVTTEVGATRLWGPFSEPGVYQMFLVFALYFYSITAKKISYFRVIVYVLAVILTKSTTGYFAIAPALIFVIMNNGSKRTKKSTYLLFILIWTGL